MRVFSADRSGAGRFLIEIASSMGLDADLCGPSMEDPDVGEASVMMLRNVPLSVGKDLAVAAVMRPWGSGYSSFPAGLEGASAVAVSDPCVRRQLLLACPDMEVFEEDGLEGCMEAMESGRAEALVAPSAELRLSGRGIGMQCGALVPAPSQGAVAVVCRKDDPETLATARRLEDRRTRIEVGAERGILRLMRAGPLSPVGVSASLEDMFVHIEAVSFLCGDPRRFDDYVMSDYVMDDLLGIAEYLNGDRSYVVRGSA